MPADARGAGNNFHGTRRQRTCVYEKACANLGMDRPPQPPFQCFPDNMLLFQYSIHLHTLRTAKVNCSRVMGQILSCARYTHTCTAWHPQWKDAN
eukprot:1156350-Pelagomonas_calceolata.AAC.15